MMCQCRFTFGKKCSIRVSDVDTGEGYVWVGERGIWEISAPSSLFYCKPKAALFKTNVFLREEYFTQVSYNLVRKTQT